VADCHDATVECNLGELVEEAPNLTGHVTPRTAVITVVDRRRCVSAIERNPRNRVPSPAARVLSLDMAPATRRRLFRTLRLASVVLNKSIPQLSSIRDIQRSVANTMDTKIRNRIIATRTSAQLRARNDGHSTEVLAARTRNRVRHTRSVRETH
jgi:hypothetical protein